MNVMNTSLPSGLHAESWSTQPNTTYFVMGSNSMFGSTEMTLGRPIDIYGSYNNPGCLDEKTVDIWYCKGYGAATCNLFPLRQDIHHRRQQRLSCRKHL